MVMATGTGQSPKIFVGGEKTQCRVALSLKQYSLVIMCSFFAVGCDIGKPDQMTSAPLSGSPLFVPQMLDKFSQRQADDAVSAVHSSDLREVSQIGLSADEHGLINENRERGKLFSPRFQRGAGLSLRIGLVQNDVTKARRSFSAIKAGADTIHENGFVPSYLPQDRFPGKSLSEGDIASGAAFFLAEACTAMLALESDKRRDVIASATTRAAIIAALGRGVDWLKSQDATLKKYDHNAPNRLLFDALAFQACGRLTRDEASTSLAASYVKQALSFVRKDGVFIEKQGSDSNYQALAVQLALEIQLSGFSGNSASELRTAWKGGATWLAQKVRADGSLNSLANTRTCSGGETFLNNAKTVNLPGVFVALAYAGTIGDLPIARSAATRLAGWARRNPRLNPCQ